LVAPEPYSAPRYFASTQYPTRRTLQGLRYLYDLIVQSPTDFGTRF